MNDAWRDKNLPFETRAEALLECMTLEEKISQMTFMSSALSRFAIPEYNWWNECLHGVARAGVATMFPQPIGMAASFDDEALYKVASIISDEARIKHHAAAEMEDRGIYKGLTMWTPNINIFRDPRWGRGHETYGEDPHLTARMGVAFIKGLQGGDSSYYKCIATAKHFAVHSGPEADRHSFDAHVTKKDMYETYLPAFKAAVQEAGVYSVMGAYNRVNGEAACASKTLLQDILRDEWGFEGYVVSDCGAVEDIFKFHKIAADGPEAAAMAVKGGCDLCCGQVFGSLNEAVKRGLLEEADIDKSVLRLLIARMRLGMFDDGAQAYKHLPYDLNDSQAHHQASLRMAEDSLVLLKNDGALPLDANKIKTIAVIGPNADSRAALYGNYAGTPSITYTILEGLREVLPDVKIYYAEGSALTGGSAEEGWGEGIDYRVSEALKVAELSDVAIIVTGLNGECEGEEGYGSGDRTTMDLPKSQLTLLEALRSVSTPKVLLNMTGSATLFPNAEQFSAIMQVWYPGQMGGVAVANALTGRANGFGKLPVTFYASMAQVPDFADYSMKGRTYRYFEGVPAYPFGYGLSYTRFEYANLVAERGAYGVRLTVDVKNAGARDGKEAVQAYVRLIDPAHDGPRWQLAAFKRAAIAAGDTKSVALVIAPEMLSSVDDEGRHIPHEGEIELFVSGGQPDERTIALTGQAPLRIRL